MRIPRAAWFRIGSDGDPYPEVVRELNGYSGCYMIRRSASRRVLYVGESHTGRLRATLTRHFQRWRRSSGKTFWERLYGRRNDPGTTYSRGTCEIAVFLTNASEALSLEAELIRRYRPTDNLIEVEEVPF